MSGSWKELLLLRFLDPFVKHWNNIFRLAWFNSVIFFLKSLILFDKLMIFVPNYTEKKNNIQSLHPLVTLTANSFFIGLSGRWYLPLIIFSIIFVTLNYFMNKCNGPGNQKGIFFWGYVSSSMKFGCNCTANKRSSQNLIFVMKLWRMITFTLLSWTEGNHKCNKD